MAVVGQAADELVTIDGKYLRLITDLPSSESHQDLVDSFDQAVPLWLDYWGRDGVSVDGWRMTGYLMQSKANFQKRGLIPSSLPEFLNGFQAGDKLWVNQQASQYYTTHLLLHEGAHGIAEKLFGGAGPPWYMEGTAEFLATHVRTDDGLKVGIIPADRESSPYWGRLGLIATRRSEGKMPTLETVMRYGDTAHREVEPYAWSWAASVLLEAYPEYRQPFRAAATGGADASPQFTRQFFESLRSQWPIVVSRWQLLCNDLDYGFDVTQNRVLLDSTIPKLAGKTVTMKLAAAQGWQSAPVQVRNRQRILIRATGRIQLHDDPTWTSEPDGVTITYHRGQPLGCVLACVIPSNLPADRYLPKLKIVNVGSNGEIISPCEGWLLFKVNDTPSSISDNHGSFDLQIDAASG